VLIVHDADEWADAIEEAAAAEEEHGLPRPVVELHGAVSFYDPTDAARRFGRHTVPHMGTAKEAYSIYCNLHGCKRMRKPHAYPSAGPEWVVLRRWLRDGADETKVPRGKRGRIQHEAMFDALPRG
jgi:hypothetical protein